MPEKPVADSLNCRCFDATWCPAEHSHLHEGSWEALFCDLEIRKESVRYPGLFGLGRTCLCRNRIAREEQALLAVSVVLKLTRRNRFS